MQLANPLMERDALMTAEAVDAAVPVTTRQEGPLRVEGPGLGDKVIVPVTTQQQGNLRVKPETDYLGRYTNAAPNYARGGIVSLVRR